MRDKYMISVASKDNNYRIYCYGDSVIEATDMLGLADFIPDTGGMMNEFFQFCEHGVEASPGHHAFYASMNAGEFDKLYIFVLHVIDPPETIPVFPRLKSTAFGFRFNPAVKNKINESGDDLYELDLVINPVYVFSEHTGSINNEHRKVIAERVLNEETYDPETMGIGVFAFAPSGLSKTVNGFYVEAITLGASKSDDLFIFCSLPNINEENAGIRIDNPPKGFSL